MRWVLVVVAAAMVVTLFSAPPAVAARGAIVVSAPSTSSVYQVDTDASDTYDKEFFFDLEGTDTGAVTVTATGDEGTTAYPASQIVDPAGWDFGRVNVRASPGLHTMTLMFSAAGAAPQTRTYRLWAAGGPPLPATGDLTGARWAYDRGYSYEARYVQQHDAIWFVDDRWAYVGIPRHGLPTCARGTAGCVRYWYDAEGSDLVQVGDGAIGQIGPRGLFLDGRGGHEEEDMWARRTYDVRVGFYGPGRRLEGAWRWADRSAYVHDIAEQATLRLHRDETFRWTTVPDAQKARTRTGHYALGAHGALRLRAGSWRQTLTFAPCLDATGAKAPGTCVAMSFATRDGWSGGVFTSVR